LQPICCVRPSSIGIHVEPRLIQTSKYSRGGALNRDRVLRFLRNTLRERSDTYVTTFFDLYALDAAFPGASAARHLQDPLARADTIEHAFAAEVTELAGCRPDRFIPHIQPYEYESLLFADVTRIVDMEPSWQRGLATLSAARAAFATPEHVNDGQATHPSARLATALTDPTYRKVLHGSRATASIGLQAMRVECFHFHGWLSKIERLPAHLPS
jgi:hypothetical protein